MAKHSFRLTMAALLCALVLLGTVGLHQADDVALAQTDVPAAAQGAYVVQAGTASGGSYKVSSQSWQVSCTAHGGSYRLQGPQRPNQGAGCCCAFLPILPTSWP